MWNMATQRTGQMTTVQLGQRSHCKVDVPYLWIKHSLFDSRPSPSGCSFSSTTHTIGKPGQVDCNSGMRCLTLWSPSVLFISCSASKLASSSYSSTLAWYITVFPSKTSWTCPFGHSWNERLKSHKLPSRRTKLQCSSRRPSTCTWASRTLRAAWSSCLWSAIYSSGLTASCASLKISQMVRYVTSSLGKVTPNSEHAASRTRASLKNTRRPTLRTHNVRERILWGFRERR